MKLKKTILMAVLLIISVFLFFVLSASTQFAMFINWGLYFPNATKSDIVFDDFFRDGDQIFVYTISDNKQLDKMIEINKFIPLDNNDEIISTYLYSFHNRLNEDGKNIFSDMEFDKLSNYDFFLIKGSNKKSFIILLLSIDNSEVHCLTSIRWFFLEQQFCEQIKHVS